MKRFLNFFIFYILFVSCSTVYQINKLNYTGYTINNKTTRTDSAMLYFLTPYSDSVHHTMDIVIGEIGENLEKKQPNGSLGLVLVDALRTIASEKYKTTVDAAFINNGGIRIPSVPQGNITIGKVFEVMPFDNVIVLQKLNGQQLKSFLDLIAKGGGWPVSGISFTIADKKATDIFINGKPLDLQATYTILNSDYIANGGDDAAILRSIPKINDNYLMRDLFIDFFKAKKAKGEKVYAPKEERIKIR